MIGWIVAVYLALAAFALGGTLGAWVTARTRHPHWLCGYCAGRRAMPDADHPCDDPRRAP